MPTLYTLKEVNIRKTWLYLSGFFLLIVFLGWFLSYFWGEEAIFFLALFLSLISSFGSYWFSDRIVLALTRAKKITKEEAPELYRLVENLSIAAGLPMPAVYLMAEKAPNAFATGRDPNHSALVVTEGLLETLERVELEGVLAHEMAHIGNRDTLLQTAVVVLVGLVVRLSDLFLRSRLGRSRRRRDDSLALPFLIFGLALLILAPLMAQLLRLAISRKREFLADATGALITRYPEGLARALEKIAASPKRLKVASNATAHLFIVNPFKGEDGESWLTKLFSTHPPIKERIAALRAMNV